MAWGVVQSNSVAAAGTVTAAAYLSNLSAGTKLVVASVIASGPGSAPACSDGTNSFTNLVFNRVGTDDIMLFALDTPAGKVGTTPTISITGATSNGCAILIQEVSGLLAGNTSAMLDGTPSGVQQAFTGAATGSVPSAAYSSTALNEYLFALWGDNGDNGVTNTGPGGSYTRDAKCISGNSASNIAFAYKNSANGAESATYSWANNNGMDGALILGAFKISAAAPSGLIPQQLKQRAAYQTSGSRPVSRHLASYRG